MKVNAGARSERVRLLEDGLYQVRTMAAPERGRANRRVLELLAGELGCTPDCLRIVTGSPRPLKTIAFENG